MQTDCYDYVYDFMTLTRNVIDITLYHWQIKQLEYMLYAVKCALVNICNVTGWGRGQNSETGRDDINNNNTNICNARSVS